MMKFDEWLLKQADKYCAECVPEVIEQWVDNDGNTERIYNCEECDCKECEYWEKYN